jgi:hypothetical protein
MSRKFQVKVFTYLGVGAGIYWHPKTFGIALPFIQVEISKS